MCAQSERKRERRKGAGEAKKGRDNKDEGKNTGGILANRVLLAEQKCNLKPVYSLLSQSLLKNRAPGLGLRVLSSLWNAGTT